MRPCVSVAYTKLWFSPCDGPSFADLATKCSTFTLERLREDWIFLLLLGILTALCSVAVDVCIDRVQGGISEVVVESVS